MSKEKKQVDSQQQAQLENKWKNMVFEIHTALYNPLLKGENHETQWKTLRQLPSIIEGIDNKEKWFCQNPNNPYILAIDQMVDAVVFYAASSHMKVSVDDFLYRMPNKHIIAHWDQCMKSITAENSKSFDM